MILFFHNFKIMIIINKNLLLLCLHIELYIIFLDIIFSTLFLFKILHIEKTWFVKFLALKNHFLEIKFKTSFSKYTFNKKHG